MKQDIIGYSLNITLDCFIQMFVWWLEDNWIKNEFKDMMGWLLYMISFYKYEFA